MSRRLKSARRWNALVSAAVLGGSVMAGGCSASSADEATDPLAACEGEECTGVPLCAASLAGPAVLRRLTGREFAETLRDVFPEVRTSWTAGFSADPVSHWGFDNEASRLVVGKQTAREIDTTGRALAEAVVAELPGLLPCSGTTPDRGCAGEFVDKYGKRLFRRPVSAEEKEKYLGFFDLAAANVTFPEAIGWLTRALVHATATVYRSEIGTPEENGRKLSQHEIATALPYTFAGTTPGDRLLEMADRGELSSPEVLSRLANELIQTDLGKAHLHRFFDSFLEYSRVSTLAKPGVPEFESQRDAMREETRRFIDALVINGGGGMREVLTSSVTYPSPDLAAFYGMSAPGPDGSVTRSQGLGILAQGSVLSTEASPDASSPTQRGLLVYERLLCGDELLVPPDVPDIPPVEAGVTTTRERYENVHARGACASCHANFDPIGFGFEHFDEVGRYRADEGGLPINSAAEIPGTDIRFSGQEELAQGLASLDQVHLCTSAQLRAYAFGTDEACLAEGARQEFVEGAVGFVEYKNG